MNKINEQLRINRAVLETKITINELLLLIIIDSTSATTEQRTDAFYKGSKIISDTLDNLLNECIKK